MREEGGGWGRGALISGLLAVFHSFQLYPVLFSSPVQKYRAIVTFTSALVWASSFMSKFFFFYVMGKVLSA